MASKRGGNPIEGPAPKKKPVHWSMALSASMEDPEMVVHEDDLCVIIKDKYPKARHHYLVLPKAQISSLRALDRTHLDLVKHLHQAGQEFVAKFTEKDHNLKFRFGFHAEPSMNRLHMHAISQDLDSPCLKNKKHWNSFTTDFFISSQTIIKMLREQGKIELDVARYKELLKNPLQCHVCHRDLSNMPQLKDHIKVHIKKS